MKSSLLLIPLLLVTLLTSVAQGQHFALINITDALMGYTYEVSNVDEQQLEKDSAAFIKHFYILIGIHGYFKKHNIQSPEFQKRMDFAATIFERMGLRPEEVNEKEDFLIWAGLGRECAYMYQDELKELFGIEVEAPDTIERYCYTLRKQTRLTDLLAEIDGFANKYDHLLDSTNFVL